MSITIYRRDGSVAFVAEAATTLWEAVESAVKSRANLYGADLYGADLSRADLSGARGFNPFRTTALAALALTGGRAFKLVAADGGSPIQSDNRIIYEHGAPMSVDAANTDPAADCAEGINLCDLPWAMRNWRDGWRILVAEFEPIDVAVVPHGTDGKFRVHRCRTGEPMTYDTHDVAQILGLHPTHVRLLARKMGLQRTEKAVRRSWSFTEADIATLAERPRQPHRWPEK